MKKRLVFVSAIAAALLVYSGFARAADSTANQENSRIQQQEHIFGSQLMTPQERMDYLTRIHAAKTIEDAE